MEKIAVNTNEREELIDITNLVQKKVTDKNWEEGILLLFCPHTTGALTINENADPSVTDDMTNYLHKMIPQQGGFNHSEGNSDAHIKSTLIGPSLMLIVNQRQIQLGTWQGVYFFEGDGPRQRHVWMKFMPC